MSETRQTPTLTEKARDQAEERRRRQAEALRANLARRKTQARSRAETDADRSTAADDAGDGGATP